MNKVQKPSDSQACFIYHKSHESKSILEFPFFRREMLLQPKMHQSGWNLVYACQCDVLLALDGSSD
jgi:hypothetical protein